MSSLGTFLRNAWNGSIEVLAYLWMVLGCKGCDDLLRVPLYSIESRYTSGSCWLHQNMAADPVLAMVAIERLTETYWEAVANQDWFSYY